MRDALACIEAGGTKFVCGVAAGDEAPRNVVRIETTSPDETLRRSLNERLNATPAPAPSPSK